MSVRELREAVGHAGPEEERKARWALAARAYESMLRCLCADISPRADYYVGCIIIIVVVALMTLYHKQ